MVVLAIVGGVFWMIRLALPLGPSVSPSLGVMTMVHVCPFAVAALGRTSVVETSDVAFKLGERTLRAHRVVRVGLGRQRTRLLGFLRLFGTPSQGRVYAARPRCLRMLVCHARPRVFGAFWRVLWRVSPRRRS